MNYSQNNEQELIHKVFGDFVGRFLDIGACDGTWLSNTRDLVERGWSGVLVEASPMVFLALQGLHGTNPKLDLVNAAVGLRSGLSTFWDSPTAQGYSTTEVGNRDKWHHLAGEWGKFYVPVVETSTILNYLPGPIDFLSIDTEGTSADLFFGFPFFTVTPRMVCVEHDGRLDECVSFAKSVGYRELSRNPENLLFIQVDLD